MLMEKIWDSKKNFTEILLHLLMKPIRQDTLHLLPKLFCSTKKVYILLNVLQSLSKVLRPSRKICTENYI